MKKGLTILIAALIVASALVGITMAEDYEISTELAINGTGSFDRELNVQTELGYAGKSLEEDYYTRWMGTDGDSKIQYTRENHSKRTITHAGWVRMAIQRYSMTVYLKSSWGTVQRLTIRR
jgi:hypothetical protein